jgi:sulfite reductase (NADPH) flavoprotein alpha-component
MSAQPANDIPLPLPAEKSLQLERLVQGLDTAGLLWVSGYTAGLARFGSVSPSAAAPAAAANPQHAVTVLYGTQTGNSRQLAQRLKDELDGVGVSARLLRASEYPLRELKQERCLLLVISTQGDGDPPDDAIAFVEFIGSKKAPSLSGLSYSVLALGDSGYPRYCAVGRKLDTRLAELGGTRIAPLAECDLDFEPAAAPWIKSTGSTVQHTFKHSPPLAAVTPLRRLEVVPTHDRKRPFAAPVLTNQRITGRDAGKDVRHIELSLAGADIHYEPGDSLGVWLRNPLSIVQPLLEALRLDGDVEVTRDGRSLPLVRWLSEELEITRLSRPILAKHAERADSAELARLLTQGAEDGLGRLLRDHQLIDLLRLWPANWDAQELVLSLRALAPRSYSIASSRKLVEDEAHLTVAVVDYVFSDFRHRGAASSHLAGAETGEVQVFLETNLGFRLPADPARDVVMIGPGTGVAPFRAFVQERAAVGAKGRNWLFFGEQFFRSQFLYQSEWQEALKRGQLHQLDLAFSRDQAEKVYVQHRLAEKGRELYAWLESGAHLYVCGDAQRMAKDVHNTLLDVVTEHGGKDREQAQDYLIHLQQQGRYARDIY